MRKIIFSLLYILPILGLYIYCYIMLLIENGLLDAISSLLIVFIVYLAVCFPYFFAYYLSLCSIHIVINTKCLNRKTKIILLIMLLVIFSSSMYLISYYYFGGDSLIKNISANICFITILIFIITVIFSNKEKEIIRD